MKESLINVIVTAGGTSEPIDNVRRIANTGTGRLGSLIAEELAADAMVGHIFYVCAKDSFRPVSEKVVCVEIESVSDLQAAVTELMEKNEIHGIIHSMAVSDYTVRSVTTVESLVDFLANDTTNDMKEKILKGMDQTDIRSGGGKLSSQMKSPLLLLEPTPKIISMFRKMAPQAVIVGFKLLSNVSKEDLLDTAHRLLVKNDCDYVLANDAKEINTDHHHAYLLDKEKNSRTFDTKAEIAKGIADIVLREVKRK